MSFLRLLGLPYRIGGFHILENDCSSLASPMFRITPPPSCCQIARRPKHEQTTKVQCKQSIINHDKWINIKQADKFHVNETFQPQLIQQKISWITHSSNEKKNASQSQALQTRASTQRITCTITCHVQFPTSAHTYTQAHGKHIKLDFFLILNEVSKTLSSSSSLLSCSSKLVQS